MENNEKPIDGIEKEEYRRQNAISIFADKQKLRIFSLIKLEKLFRFSIRGHGSGKRDEVSRLISQFDRPRNSLGRISRIENNIIMALLVSSPSGCHHRKLIKSILPPSYEFLRILRILRIPSTRNYWISKVEWPPRTNSHFFFRIYL